jgi:hypothetical protein
LILTAPSVTVKSAVAKEATPRFVVVAISASTVRVPALSSYVTSMPSPATICEDTISCTRSAFNVTAPDVTVKSVESKLATPLRLHLLLIQ